MTEPNPLAAATIDKVNAFVDDVNKIPGVTATVDTNGAVRIDAGDGSLPRIPIKTVWLENNVRAGKPLDWIRGDDDFVASIETQGILVPCQVAILGPDHPARKKGFDYEAITGHRRMVAESFVRGDDATAPCEIVPPQEDAERWLGMLIENLQRKDLDPIEEALGYQRIVGLGWSQKELAANVGRSEGHISGRLKLLRLTDDEHADIRDGKLTLEDAMALAGVADEKDRKAVRARPHWQSIADAVHGINKRKRDEATLAKAEGELDRLGVKHKRQRPNGAKKVDGASAGLYGNNIRFTKPAEHKSEPCHLVVVSLNYQGKVVEEPFCVDAGRHDPKSNNSKLKAVVSKEEAAGAAPARPKAQEESPYQKLRRLRKERTAKLIELWGEGPALSKEQEQAVWFGLILGFVREMYDNDTVDAWRVRDDEQVPDWELLEEMQAMKRTDLVKLAAGFVVDDLAGYAGADAAAALLLEALGVPLDKEEREQVEGYHQMKAGPQAAADETDDATEPATGTDG